MVKPDTYTLDLGDSTDPSKSDPELVFIVKDIQNDDPYVGSISITRSTLIEGEQGRPYQMWFTLFDSQSDDEYDGAMGLTDDEDPRILMELTVFEKVKEVSPARKPRKAEVAKPTVTAPPVAEPRRSEFAATTKTSTGSRLLNPIGNFKGQAPPVEQPKPVVAVKTPVRTSNVKAPAARPVRQQMA